MRSKLGHELLMAILSVSFFLLNFTAIRYTTQIKVMETECSFSCPHC